MAFALSDLKLTSTAFEHLGPIPDRYTCEGEDVSPALSWSNVPEGTVSFAVYCHDPDAPKIAESGSYGFSHWLLYNIPPSVTALEEGEMNYAQGRNDFGNLGYGGPMPPNGHGLHHYYFWVLALNVQPSLPDGLELDEFLERIEPHVLGMNRLMGTFKRD